MSDIVIEVRDLTKRYGSTTAVIARLLEMKEAANAFWHFCMDRPCGASRI